MTETTALAALTKTITVPVPVDRAFDLFSRRLGEWWPLATHSVGEESAVGVEMGCRVGGEIVETVRDGSVHVWGTVTDWEPPERMAFTWHPGQDAAEATRVEVTFEPAGESTVVTLTHSGWEALEGGAGIRRNYDSGWDLVLARLVAAAGA